MPFVPRKSMPLCILAVLLVANFILFFTYINNLGTDNARAVGLTQVDSNSASDRDSASDLSDPGIAKSGTVDEQRALAEAVNLQVQQGDSERLLAVPAADKEKSNFIVEPPDEQYYRLQSTKVNEYKYKLLIRGDNICNDNTDLVIVVNSSPSNVAKRQAIRKTWAGAAKTNTWPRRPISANVKLAFVFGIDGTNKWNTRVAEEYVYFGDVIQGNFIDSYNNLTLKSLLAMKWVTEFCSSTLYVLKCDDDTFINIPYLLSYLSTNLTNMNRFILGFVNAGSEVQRMGKWRLAEEVFPFHTFPPYEGGSAYVMSADVNSELFEASEYVPAIYIDDVYITGILGKIKRVNHLHHAGFAWAYAPPPTLCDVLMDRTMTFTRLDEKDMLKAWSVLTDSKGSVCQTDSDLTQRKKETRLNYVKPWYK